MIRQLWRRPTGCFPIATCRPRWLLLPLKVGCGRLGERKVGDPDVVAVLAGEF